MTWISRGRGGVTPFVQGRFGRFTLTGPAPAVAVYHLAIGPRGLVHRLSEGVGTERSNRQKPTDEGEAVQSGLYGNRPHLPWTN